MSDDDEVIELRALQARAYGRGGELTPAESARLEHLIERRNRASARTDVAAPAREATSDHGAEELLDAHALDAPDRTELVADAAPESTAAEEGTPSRTDASPRVRWRALLAGGLAVLALGIGVGWFLFGRAASEAVALTPAQQDWQNEIIGEATYDLGSLRAVAVEADVVLWYATKRDGDLKCLVLGDGAHTTSECDTEEAVREGGLYGTLMVERGEGQTEISAQMMLTPEGEPAAITDSYLYDPGMTLTTYANEEEERFAQSLAEQGFDSRTVWVVGYDEEAPIWTGVRTEESLQCLIYGPTLETADISCADTANGDRLAVDHVDPDTQQNTHVEWQMSAGRGANLVITRGGAGADAVDE